MSNVEVGEGNFPCIRLHFTVLGWIVSCCQIKRGENMCLAVPMKLIARDGEIGTVELGGVERKINLMMLPDAKIGEYMVVHAGFAIQRLDEAEAKKTLDLLMQMGEDYGESISPDFSDSSGDKKPDPE